MAAIPKSLCDDARMVLASEPGKRLFAHLREHFGVDAPVFQKTRDKHDDQLFDALLRDGAREPILYVAALANQAKQNDE